VIASEIPSTPVMGGSQARSRRDQLQLRSSGWAAEPCGILGDEVTRRHGLQTVGSPRCLSNLTVAMSFGNRFVPLNHRQVFDAATNSLNTVSFGAVGQRAFRPHRYVPHGGGHALD